MTNISTSTIFPLSFFIIIFSTQINAMNKQNRIQEEQNRIQEEQEETVERFTLSNSYQIYLNNCKFIISSCIVFFIIYAINVFTKCVHPVLVSLVGMTFIFYGVYLYYLTKQASFVPKFLSGNVFLLGMIFYLSSFFMMNTYKK